MANNNPGKTKEPTSESKIKGAVLCRRRDEHGEIIENLSYYASALLYSCSQFHKSVSKDIAKDKKGKQRWESRYTLREKLTASMNYLA